MKTKYFILVLCLFLGMNFVKAMNTSGSNDEEKDFVEAYLKQQNKNIKETGNNIVKPEKVKVEGKVFVFTLVVQQDSRNFPANVLQQFKDELQTGITAEMAEKLDSDYTLRQLFEYGYSIRYDLKDINKVLLFNFFITEESLKQ